MTPRRDSYDDYFVDIMQSRDDSELMFMKELIHLEEDKLNEDEKFALIRMIARKIAGIT